MISIGQTLHGYSEGHTLLASSVSLPYEVDSELFVLSDLSGQTFVKGFDGYLTGHPLPKINSFAFSKTWYASEMERPGCVWTHTLLIRNADLARLQSPDVLLELFQRPRSKSGPWPNYEQRLQIPEESAQKHPTWTNSTVNGKRSICDALYATERPVIVFADDTDEFTDVFLKIWAQQWPGLRRRFTFCTGSIEGRELNGRPFDLQCMPGNSRSLAHRIRDSVAIDDFERAFRLEPAILEMITTDLQLGGSQLREFARTYGADAPAKRSTFAALARILASIDTTADSPNGFSVLINLIVSEFPKPDQAKKLKTDIILQLDDDWKIGRGLSRQSRVVALGTDQENVSSLLQSIDISDIATRFLDAASFELMATVEDLIRANRINAFGQQLISQVSKIIEPEALSERTSPAVLFVLLGTNPALAETEQIWALLKGRTYELVDSLAGANLSAEQWDRICRASIKFKAADVASHIVVVAGGRMILTALDYLDQYDAFDSSFTQWFNEAARHELETFNWLSERSHLGMAVRWGLATALDPQSVFLRSKGLSLWLGLESEEDDRRLAFVMIIASYSNEPGAPEVFSRSFSRLHEIAKRSALGNGAGYLLRSWLPNIGVFRDWDTCERLRRALCRRFAEANWPVHMFLAGFSETEDLREAFDYIASEKALREFARRVVREVDIDKIPLWQVKPLEELAKRLKKY